MTTANSVLMDEAKASLKGKWKFVVKVTLIVVLINVITGFIPVLGSIAQFLINGPLLVGSAIIYLAIIHNEKTELSQLFEGFDNWTRYFIAYLLRGLYTFLWFLLLIIPGIVYTLAYSQTFFILAEDKNISPRDAIRKSKEMMKGYKWKLFRLMLRFAGWIILCILTLGIGFLWLFPYIYATAAKFYEDIKPKTEPELESIIETEVIEIEVVQKDNNS
ncbi:DUF975 family protein [Candidatus Nomurabacteria bacterium]|nr:DUF975 family protein [Candidatus Nomurabacteria bacterium]